MTAKRIVTPDEIDHLPTAIHKKVARQLILTGEWAMATTSGEVTHNEMRMD
jgi:hypothetical protein